MLLSMFYRPEQLRTTHRYIPSVPYSIPSIQLPKTKRQQQIVKTPVLHKKHLNENLKIAAKKTIRRRLSHSETLPDRYSG
jgi:hypothetical protein